ncbi:MAG: hypothetical protein Ct9H300mP23_05180 [Nitrospinota bacterium]|nr:MAG: hypothetical protein Ct9H300mP23_05180 [Nitrospinota bacterium]
MFVGFDGPETMQCIVDREIDTVVELGPGKVLSGLMRRFEKVLIVIRWVTENHYHKPFQL